MTTTINGRTPEEIKKGLKFLGTTNVTEKVELASQGLAYAYYEDFAVDTLAYIQQLEEQVPKWISVDERLPENDDNYLVFTSDRNDAVIATYYGDGEWLEYDLINLIPLVTHWMPIPQLPETE